MSSPLIWIVDDDPVVSFKLKNQLKAKGAEVSVFDRAELFSQKWEEYRKRDRKKLPHLILVDPVLENESGIKIFLQVLETEESFKSRLGVFTLAGYGRFEKIAELHHLNIPYYSKVNFEKNVPEWIELARKAMALAQAELTPIQKRALRDFDLLIKKMNEAYYESRYVAIPSLLLKDLQSLIKIVPPLQWTRPLQKASRFVSELSAETVTSKQIKALKEIIGLFETEREKL